MSVASTCSTCGLSLVFVGYRGVPCTQCKKVMYCSPSCLTADVPAHTPTCEVKPVSPPKMVGEHPAYNVPALLEAARRGNVAAMYNLGVCYTYGADGVAPNEYEAFRWFTAAAQAPSPPAEVYNSVAICHHRGRGTPKDEAQAVYWWSKGAQAGDIISMNEYGISLQLGEGVPTDPVAGFSWLQRAAVAGDPGSAAAIGTALVTGFGVRKDVPAGIAWYTAAAHKGDATAMCNLARAHKTGEGVPVDFEACLTWLQRAKAAGNVPASRMLESLINEQLTPEARAAVVAFCASVPPFPPK